MQEVFFSVFGHRPPRPGIGRGWRCRIGALLSACGCLAALGGAGAFAETPQVTQRPADTLPQLDVALPAEHVSVFISDPTFGKDPFFPDSTRRVGQLPVPAPDRKPTNLTSRLDVLWDQVTCKGISIYPTKRLAIINHYTFAEGEEREIKVADQVYKARCITVNERSAVMSIRGQTKELSLREGL